MQEVFHLSFELMKIHPYLCTIGWKLNMVLYLCVFLTKTHTSGWTHLYWPKPSPCSAAGSWSAGVEESSVVVVSISPTSFLMVANALRQVWVPTPQVWNNSTTCDTCDVTRGQQLNGNKQLYCIWLYVYCIIIITVFLLSIHKSAKQI